MSVRWYIVGYGDYMLETVGGSPAKYMPVDRAVDVYLDEWVQIDRVLYPRITQTKYQRIKHSLFI